ncbi:hypothetical protein HDV63DRAFT_50803 [Trichoderma sp. SZMC 28014]
MREIVTHFLTFFFVTQSGTWDWSLGGQARLMDSFPFHFVTLLSSLSLFFFFFYLKEVWSLFLLFGPQLYFARSRVKKCVPWRFCSLRLLLFFPCRFEGKQRWCRSLAPNKGNWLTIGRLSGLRVDLKSQKRFDKR